MDKIIDTSNYSISEKNISVFIRSFIWLLYEKINNETNIKYKELWVVKIAVSINEDKADII